MNNIDLIKIIDNLKKKHSNKNRECYFKDCKNRTLNHSHVLQKNGILNNLEVRKHILQFKTHSSFERNKKGLFSLETIGINKAFTFPGFCNYHDDNLFASIEKTDIDFNERSTHILFAYRAICNEIYRKEVMRDLYQDIVKTTNIPFNVLLLCANQANNEIYGLQNLFYFKKGLEDEIESVKSNFIFDFTPFKKIDICVSAPLNILDSNNPKSFEDDNKILNYVTSTVNIFPYKNYSYLLTSYHKDYNCYWTKNLNNDFKSSNDKEKLEILSNFLATRTEFWCISEKLYQRIGKIKFDELLEIFKENIRNYNSEINLNFNLFEEYY